MQWRYQVAASCMHIVVLLLSVVAVVALSLEVDETDIYHAKVTAVQLYQKGASITSDVDVTFSAPGSRHLIHIPMTDLGTTDRASCTTRIYPLPVPAAQGATCSDMGEACLPSTTKEGKAWIAQTTFQYVTRINKERMDSLELEKKNVSHALEERERSRTQMTREKDWIVAFVSKMLHPSMGDTQKLSMEDALTGIHAAQEKLLHLEAAIHDHDVVIDVYRRQLDRIREDQNLASVELLVMTLDVEVARPGTFVIKTIAIDANSGWSPSYELDLATDDGVRALSVRYIAEIRQRSTCDWTKTSLELSTGSISLNTSFPEVPLWKIDLVPPQPVHHGGSFGGSFQNQPQRKTAAAGARAGVQFANVFSTTESAGGLEYDDVEQQPEAEVRPGHYFDLFVVPGAHTLNRTGKTATRLTVATSSMENVQVETVALPKFNKNPFLRALFKNPTMYTFLAGPAKTHMDGVFSGTTVMPYLPPAAAGRVELGIDSAIVVTRTVLLDERHDISSGLSTFGLGSNKKAANRHVRITIDNKRSVGVDVIVREQVPIPSHKDLDVRLEEPHASASLRELLRHEDVLLTTDAAASLRASMVPLVNATLLKFQGLVEWKRTIPPHQRSVVNLKYSVMWPDDDSRLVLNGWE